MSAFGGESWNWIKAILAFSTRSGPPAVLSAGWVNISPGIISVSSIVPPTLRTTRISLRSTLKSFAGSMTCKTASTAIGANKLEYWETTLEEREVVADFNRDSLSLRSTGKDISFK
eukprot:Lithocolla_globosa_v1_NODE_3463_length_1662_cov_41.947729.p2 type:complete len:116 gc:universal NODE_3463_length_1662_cov_41.947729:808-461(-)